MGTIFYLRQVMSTLSYSKEILNNKKKYLLDFWSFFKHDLNKKKRGDFSNFISLLYGVISLLYYLYDAYLSKLNLLIFFICM